METVNDVLHFSNELDFAGYLESDDNEKFNCIRKVSTEDFQDINTGKLIKMLGVVDDLYFLFITQDFNDVQILTSNLHGGIFLLVNEKMEGE